MSRFAAALAALPASNNQQFQLLVKAGFFHEDVEFGAGEALASVRCGRQCPAVNAASAVCSFSSRMSTLSNVSDAAW